MHMHSTWQAGLQHCDVLDETFAWVQQLCVSAADAWSAAGHALLGTIFLPHSNSHVSLGFRLEDQEP